MLRRNDREQVRAGANIRHTDTWVWVSLCLVLVSVIFVLAGCNGSEENATANSNESVDTNTEDSLPANLANALNARQEDDEGAYAKFSHAADYHSRLPCLTCHVRDTNASRISFPGKVEHSPCAGCHTIQFRNPQSSMCTICHNDSEEGDLKNFPPMRSFGARFAHNKHLKTNCGVCHKPSGKAFSIPKGQNAHTTCFACHSSGSSNQMASCGTCHNAGGRRLRAVQTSAAFNVGFSHASHSRRANLGCNDCHVVYARASGGKQLSSPAVAMHFARAGRKSCASCHNDSTAFGVEDFANCKRCHQGEKFTF